MFRLWRMGTSDRLSAPPAMPISAFPCRISDATSTIAWLAEAQARFTVWAGTDGGSPRAQDDLAGEVGRLDRGDDLPHHHDVDRAGIDLRPLDDLAHADPGEVERGQVAVRGSGLGEGGAAAGDHGHAAAAR